MTCSNLSRVLPLTFAAAIAFTACSDGGSSSTPAPTPSPTPVANTPPTVDAGADQTAFETRTVALAGAANDAEDDLTLTWSQTFGPGVTLSDPNAAAPTFLTPTITEDAELIFELSASDGVNDAVVDTVSITVRNVDPIGVVSPPNPHIFPLVLAMAEDDTLPFTLYPVGGGSGVGPLFEDGSADVVFVFSYIGAKLRAGGAVPDLELIFPFTWRGFFEVADQSVTHFTDLIGETVVVAGPVGTSENGGGDLIFRAAAKRQGVDPDVDLNVVYVEGIEAGSQLVFNGEAAAIAVPAPASTGMVLFSQAQGGSLYPSIDFMDVFNGPGSFPDYASIPTGQMPLGGAHASRASLETAGKRAAIELLLEVYADAASRLIEDPTAYAPLTAEAFADLYLDTGAPAPPSPTITAAILNNALLYRSDISVDDVDEDLVLWIEELLGAAPDAEFFNKEFGPITVSQ